MTPKTSKMRHCFNCGADLGAYADYDRLDTCGQPECERAAQEQARDEQRGERDWDHYDRYERGSW